ncbi:MAG: hypothetical protein ACOYK1_01410 [Vampirovibrionia bacterium]
MLSGFDLNSVLRGLMRRRIVSLVAAVLILMTVLSYLSAFSSLVTEISILNLLMGELAFAFLSISFMFPSVDNKKVIKLSAEFLVIIAVFFLLLVFVPLGEGNPAFIFKEPLVNQVASGNRGQSPTAVLVNAYVLLLINLLVFGIIYLKERLHWKTIFDDSETTVNSFKKADFSNLIAEVPEEQIKNKQQALKSRRMANELKDEVSEIFDIYLEQFSTKSYSDTNAKLSSLEEALLKYINKDITAALCLDDSFTSLEKSVFFWDDSNKEELISVFKNSSQASQAIGTGKVCQALISSGTVWYLIAEFKGNYLLLKSRAKDYAPLLDTAYKVFKYLG